ncbi:amino acid adenylation domain-containing protein [Spongiibacter nanhainus]|uniref:Amino acid adenylation domain-containing protein n=1 Tax=Spongiibacter nanhainus TaxID=2794344 RepID=A0A7T4UR49_9GAMM|nr:non-ribosomal peptide synthetase [Spongiibacter nanhainus]QQD19356.1 amino acid adenylation domain-containing protein [Spongiibacter nanhainus]
MDCSEAERTRTITKSSRHKEMSLDSACPTGDAGEGGNYLERGENGDAFHHAEVTYLPLAAAQRGMWVGEKIGPADAIYNLAEYAEIRGDINEALFISALGQVAAEAESTRVQIVETQDGPRQQISPYYRGDFPLVDFSDDPEPHVSAQVWMHKEFSRPLDLAADLLWRCALIKLGPQHYYWYHRVHHVVLDGYGGGLLTRRLADIYNALVAGVPVPPHSFLPLAKQLEIEQRYHESSRYQRDQQYWKQHLQGIPEAKSLSRGGERSGGLRRSSGYLDAQRVSVLKDLGQQAGGSLPQVLIALLASYYYRMSGEDDLVFGMPVSARVSREQRAIPAMMANAVSIRLALNEQTTFVDLIGQVASTVRSSLRHQQYRYEELRRDLGLLEGGRQISWFGVNIEPFDYDLHFGGHRCEMHNLSNGTVEDLTIFVYDRGNGEKLRIDLDANPALYSQAELDGHRDRLLTLIDKLMVTPEASLATLVWLGDEERRRQLRDWNDTDQALPEIDFIQLFERQAMRTPNAPAISCGEQGLTYSQLNTRANVKARQLLAQGIDSSCRVAVAMDRTCSLLVVLLAIQKTGAAYLPLDPSAPAERLAMILEEGQVDLLVSSGSLAQSLPGVACPVVTVEELLESQGMISVSNLRDAELPSPIGPSSTAYIIYTSGSTGRPKGVMISRRNLLNFLSAMRAELNISPSDKVLALTTVAFDIAALELYLPLLVGASIELVDRDVARDPAALSERILQRGVSVVQATPSHWQALVDDYPQCLSNLRALVGGEALPGPLAKKMTELTSTPVVNLYGPTETTVWSSVMTLSGADLDSPPIGRPLWNTQLHVLDGNRQLLPVGAVGELYIGGAGVAQGYFNRPELTAERFVPNPFAGGKLYRTGDLVRWREDGVLEYLGRNDFQIKVRGFRVEAGEIEAALQRCEGVRQAAVMLKQDPRGDGRLVAYLVADTNADGKQLESGTLRETLQQRLPDYMVPAMYVALDELPLNVNGKVDRKALPDPQWQARQQYVAPRTELESTLAAMWAEIFALDRVGIHDSFFDLGGDSLAAAKMVARLREQLGRQIPLAAVFQASTIAELAQQVEQHLEADPLATVLPLNSGGSGAPLFCVHPIIGLAWGFAGIGPYLDDGVPLYGLQAIGLRGEETLPQSMSEVASLYVEQLRQVQAAGPYRLLGWSMGGIIAHEMARCLREKGEEVEFLAILDAYPFAEGKPMERRSDSQLAINTLEFLGLDSSNPPDSMVSLTDRLCREYDILNMPMVRDIQQVNPAILEHVGRVLNNNVKLLRSYEPKHADVDILFVEATATSRADLLQHSPAVWQQFGRSLEVHQIDCHHQALLDPSQLTELGPLVATSLAAAEGRRQS